MGIKSFMGRRAKEESKKKYDAPILVEDYMTRKLVTFSPEQSILEVMESFAKHHISGGPGMDGSASWPRWPAARRRGGPQGRIRQHQCGPDLRAAHPAGP